MCGNLPIALKYDIHMSYLSAILILGDDDENK